MRKLAQRLGVEAASLYWHFKDKRALMDAMASALLAHHNITPLASDPAMWKHWFKENFRSFRSALLACRDGARLHGGTRPSTRDLAEISAKSDYLVVAGFDEKSARMALFAASQFTLGNALEQQTRIEHVDSNNPETHDNADFETSFEFGLNAMIDGLGAHL